MPAPIVRLDLAVLREALGPALVLREGQVLGGRIAEVRGRHGILLLRGVPVVAELPEGVRRGQAVRLAVAGEAQDGKVVLRLLPAEGGTAPPAPAVPPGPWIALPGGARARVEPDEEPPAGEEGPSSGTRRRSVFVRFEGSALGAVELRIDVDAAGVARTTARAAPAALAALQAAAGELEGGLRLVSRAAEVDARA